MPTISKTKLTAGATYCHAPSWRSCSSSSSLLRFGFVFTIKTSNFVAAKVRTFPRNRVAKLFAGFGFGILTFELGGGDGRLLSTARSAKENTQGAKRRLISQLTGLISILHHYQQNEVMCSIFSVLCVPNKALYSSFITIHYSLNFITFVAGIDIKQIIV